jgi:hypothetical protein
MQKSTLPPDEVVYFEFGGPAAWFPLRFDKTLHSVTPVPCGDIAYTGDVWFSRVGTMTWVVNEPSVNQLPYGRSGLSPRV